MGDWMSLDSLRPEETKVVETGTLFSIINDLLMEQRLTNRYLSEIVGENLRNDIEQENKL